MNELEEHPQVEKRECTGCGRIAQDGDPGGLCPVCLLKLVIPIPPRKRSKRSSSRNPIRFGKYELREPIGNGGMGVVHMAWQVEPIHRIVALKRIRDGEFANAEARRRFLKEAKTAAALRHPHIVPIYDVGEHKGEPFFTMELMSGGTLCKNASRFTNPKRAANLIEKLSRAVHAGHRDHILHRDLKPANILFDDQGEPHIADFGVAKRLDHENSTFTATMAGTVFYMAPEQLVHHAKRDSIAADIWSLGVILYELLAERRPFSGPTIQETIRCIVDDEPMPLERLRSGIDRDLATIVLTCLHKDPERRYMSAEALAEDIERYLHNEPILASRPSPFQRVTRFGQRHPVLVSAFALATLSLVVLTSWALISAREQERARRDEVLATNVFAARAVAGTVLAQLREYADIVAEEARDPQLADLLERRDDKRLTEHCKAFYGRHGAQNSSIDFWGFASADGFGRAYMPMPPFGKTYYVDFRFRDYYRGAAALPATLSRPVYVSRAHQSMAHDRYKLAFASPIRNDRGEFKGLLAAMISTDRHFGALELSDKRRIAVLAVRSDRDLATGPLPDEHILLVHDGVAHGEGIVVESNALRRLTARRDAAKIPPEDQLHLPPADWVETEDDYMDLLAKPVSTGVQGRWLAGVAPVGHTELAVIVQTRVEDATALVQSPFRVLAVWSIGGAVLLIGGIFVATRARKRTLEKKSFDVS